MCHTRAQVNLPRLLTQWENISQALTEHLPFLKHTMLSSLLLSCFSPSPPLSAWKVWVAQLCPTLCDPMIPWTIVHQVPPSMGFSRQEYWSGLPFPSPGDLPDPGIEPISPTLQVDSLPTELWKLSYSSPNLFLPVPTAWRRYSKSVSGVRTKRP